MALGNAGTCRRKRCVVPAVVPVAGVLLLVGCTQTVATPAPPPPSPSIESPLPAEAATPSVTGRGYPPDDGQCWGVLKWRGIVAATPSGLPCPPGYGRSGEKPTPL
jgi:hypothetical protein